uniref:3'-5' exonuclease domain-containing protein n=1 Tax=Guillardia theta TaxID=55529 RepID=A0A7S4P705_GUITH|mmetsp:Transcript_44270/g.139661  ORF Transcript_44270/g.139661 Transcript_44270/m.139661 type:complete len:536 (+) Transcript_44270:457-2064(+)
MKSRRSGRMSKPSRTEEHGLRQTPPPIGWTTTWSRCPPILLPDSSQRVVCDEASGPRQTPTQELEELETKLEQGNISPELFDEMKGDIFKRFWKELVTQDTMKRRFRERMIAVQVTNSAQFADSWIRINVLEKLEKLVGLAVEWNSGVRVKGGNRHRISIIQISTRTAVLVIQLAQILPPRVPPLLEQILSDSNIRKVGAGILMDSLKLRKDWGIQVRGRVDVYLWGRDLGYCDKGKGISAIARSVLALDYEMPSTVRKGNWEAETLSNLQLTCSALDAWIAREALCYLETLTRRPAPKDDSLPSEALARGRLGKEDEVPPPLPRAYPQQPPQQLDKGEPDMTLYIPKTDVRKPGAEAHWVWRGTRVSNRHIQTYCQVELEIEDYTAGGSSRTCSRIRLWGGEANVWEATQLIKKLLARSQLDEQYLACGLAVPAFIERIDSESVQSTALVNTPEVVAWSFFPKTLTQTFTGGRMEIRGRRERKDRERAAFFAQADAAEKAADALLGRQRPGVIIGPLPGGFDPCVMWDVTRYEL